MKQRLLTALICMPLWINAQNLHLSLMGGLANYNGDLHPAFYSLGQSKFHVALGAKYDMGEKLSLRSHFTYGSIQGSDAKGGKGLPGRNLSFKSKVLEFHAGAEYNFFSFNDQWWTPYVFATPGLYSFKPSTTNAAGDKVLLQPLGTEGQGLAGGPKKYKLMQFCIPVGVGFKYAMDEDTRIGIEFGFRKLFTDYLDDVSGTYYNEAALAAGNGTAAADLAYRGDEVGPAPYPIAGTLRGNSTAKDWYYFTALNFTTRLVLDKYKKIAGLAQSRKPKKVGCPSSKGIF